MPDNPDTPTNEQSDDFQESLAHLQKPLLQRLMDKLLDREDPPETQSGSYNMGHRGKDD